MPYLIILVLAVVLFLVKRYQQDESADPKATRDKKEKFSAINRDRGFDRRTSFIEYTGHAKCRMECRHITQAEVEEIMRDGKINYAKSDVKDKPCPTYALEGITKDNQRVRIVFAQCDLKTKVITSIDLDTDWECYCPGDDHSSKNGK